MKGYAGGVGMLGRKAVRGKSVEIPNLPVPVEQEIDIHHDYLAAVTGLFQATTAQDPDECDGAATRFAVAAYNVVGQSLCHPDSEYGLFERCVVAALSLREDLALLYEHHWHREALEAALRTAGATEFTGRWKALVQVVPATK